MANNSDFTKTWIARFNTYATEVAKLYKEDPEQVLNSIGFISVHGAINETYQNLVKQNEITKLEDLPEAEKRKYWNKSKKYSTINERRIEICRSIYLLDLLTKE